MIKDYENLVNSITAKERKIRSNAGFRYRWKIFKNIKNCELKFEYRFKENMNIEVNSILVELITVMGKNNLYIYRIFCWYRRNRRS